MEIASANVGVIFKTLAPLMIIVFAGGFLANVLQVGLHLTSRPWPSAGAS